MGKDVLEERIRNEIAEAKERGNSTCTLFDSDEKSFVKKLNEMNIAYITPRIGQYIVSVQ